MGLLLGGRRSRAFSYLAAALFLTLVLAGCGGSGGEKNGPAGPNGNGGDLGRSGLICEAGEAWVHYNAFGSCNGYVLKADGNYLSVAECPSSNGGDWVVMGVLQTWSVGEGENTLTLYNVGKEYAKFDYAVSGDALILTQTRAGGTNITQVQPLEYAKIKGVW